MESAILAMREKIEEQIPLFKKEPLSQRVTVGTGEKILRQNPNISEFRALVRDYQQAIKAYSELSDGEKDAEIKNLDALRSKFRVAK